MQSSYYSVQCKFNYDNLMNITGCCLKLKVSNLIVKHNKQIAIMHKLCVINVYVLCTEHV